MDVPVPVLPPDQFTDALSRLAVSFFAGPLLSPSDSARGRPIPVADFPGMAWTWLQPVGGKWVANAKLQPATDRARASYSPQVIDDG